jgi:hypothetical protein
MTTVCDTHTFILVYYSNHTKTTYVHAAKRMCNVRTQAEYCGAAKFAITHKHK